MTLLWNVAPARADGPLTVQTIVSSQGEQWNAPESHSLFFASYVPAPGSGAPPGPVPELATLGQLFWPSQPGSVLGHDGRQRVVDTRAFPYRTIVLMQITFDGGYATECTGWLIGPRTAATAAHCIQNAAFGWARTARVYPAADRQGAPFGSANATHFYTVLGWYEAHYPEFDYAAVRLDTDLGNRIGWVGMAVLGDDALQKRAVRVTGYPADKPEQTMWTMMGRVRAAKPLRVWYDMDTYAGQSGAPVYNAESSRSCLYCVVAIHGYGSSGEAADRYNSGVRITRESLENFLAWRNLKE